MCELSALLYTCSFVFTRPATPPVTRRASLLYIYTLLHDYNMNHACKGGTHIRMMHHTACPCATHVYTHETLPWQLFDVKYIVDHSVLHAQENCHNMSWQCKPIHVGTATNAPPHWLHTHALRRLGTHVNLTIMS